MLIEVKSKAEESKADVRMALKHHQKLSQHVLSDRKDEILKWRQKQDGHKVLMNRLIRART